MGYDNVMEEDKVLKTDATTYRLSKVLGEGAHGLVYLATDVQRQKNVALKRISLNKGPGLECLHWTLKRSLREMKILRHLRHENIVHLNHVALCELEEKSHGLNSVRCQIRNIYFSFGLMDTDLATIIKIQPLSEQHCQFFMYQLMRGLKFLHSANIIHRDLKPRNLLVNGNCDLKICDFGLARLELPSKTEHSQGKGGKHPNQNKGKPSTCEADVNNPPDDECMTGYVETRWYRAPELLLENMSRRRHKNVYGKAIDIWASGCIFAEMMLRRAMFQGDDLWEQLYLIAKAVGPVPSHMLLSDSVDHRIKSCNCVIKNNNQSEGEENEYECKCKEEQELMKLVKDAIPTFSFASTFENKDYSKDAISLCESLLNIDPKGRVDTVEAIGHPFFESLHDPEDEPSCSFSLEKLKEAFAFESGENCPRELEEMIEDEINIYKETYGHVQVVDDENVIKPLARKRSSMFEEKKSEC